ncbi:hypothetical protein ACIBG7_26615 [Nonomuraea sp. NPDC050328]|uniref:hypothetical protein n=1 Tax=Nonomuraea sp. NPDC050328 TaxID=3364361 RepID=UPI003788810B
MDELDFYVTAISAQRVLGLGMGSSLEEVTHSFGKDFVEDVHGPLLRRDYGLLEFTFHRYDRWKCCLIGVQVHRILWGDNEVIPDAVSAKYGSFSPHLAAATLSRALEARGVDLDGAARQTFSDSIKMSLVELGVEIIVLKGQDDERLQGDVWSIHLSEPKRPQLT